MIHILWLHAFFPAYIFKYSLCFYPNNYRSIKELGALNKIYFFVEKINFTKSPFFSSSKSLTIPLYLQAVSLKIFSELTTGTPIVVQV